MNNLSLIAIEQVVKCKGRLIVATSNSDWDKNGKFIGDYSDLFRRAEPFVKKYNPENLSKEDYLKAYSNNELSWQQ
jgi:hypothetical protein